MTATKQARILSVRLPETEIRKVKSVAAKRGVNLQQAVHEALEAWMSGPPMQPLASLDSLQGSLAGVDIDKMKREERELERLREQRLGLNE